MNTKKKLSPPCLLLFGVVIIIGIIFSYKNASKKLDYNQFNVKELSSEKIVIPYLKEHYKLPDYYMTKKDARKMGWNAHEGNLCNKLPGKIIGGDVFYNRENKVPDKKGRKWFEADLNYNCGSRGKDRVIFSNDGLIFVTYDHYNTFEAR